ncbi:hypothetical protein LEN26_011508 [Aphanomyces euteiches]|nr:hypothetical protein LEN26_011508 [Aphanomyces euteiches]
MADDDTCDDDAMLEAMEDAIPYPQKTAVAHFWVETGSDLAAQLNDKIISSVFSVNDSAIWSAFLPDLVQVNKARDGDLVIHVATESAKTAMSEQKITIFGKQYGVAPPRAPRSSRRGGFQGPSKSIHDHYFIDIIGIRSNFDSKKLIRLLRRSRRVQFSKAARPLFKEVLVTETFGVSIFEQVTCLPHLRSTDILWTKS